MVLLFLCHMPYTDIHSLLHAFITRSALSIISRTVSTALSF